MLRRDFIATLGAFTTFSAWGQNHSASESLPPTIAQQLAAYAHQLRYEDLDPATIEAVKGHLIDAIGCAVAAWDEKPVQITRQVALNDAPANLSRGATIIGTNKKTSIDLATFTNSAAVRQLDLNDIYIGKEIGHPSDNIPACLAVAQAEHASGKQLILAIALMYEINCRLLDTAQINMRGWDHTCFSPPAVALSVGKLMKLTQPQMVEAVNLSIIGHLGLNQTRIQDISNWKGIAAADVARNAVFATSLARAGMTGPSPIFEGRAGFFKQVSGVFKLDTANFGGAGKRFLIHDCSQKFYPAQGLTQTAIVAAIDVAREVGDLKKIQSVEIRTSEDGVDKSGKDPQKWKPETSETADHSLPYIVAKAMFDQDIGIHSYTLKAIRNPDLRAFMQKITVVADPELTAIYPKYYATTIIASLEDGRRISKRVDDIPGFATRPMTRADYDNKFKKYAKETLSSEQIQSLLETAWRLDHQNGVDVIYKPLIAQTHHVKGEK